MTSNAGAAPPTGAGETPGAPPAKPKKQGGLAGVVVGKSALATVGQPGSGLTYRGYAIEDLAAHASFEEVAFLLLRGHLPTAAELEAYQANLRGARTLPAPVRTVLEQLPADANPMDVLRTGVSVLGVLEPEGDDNDQYAVADRLLATMPGMLLYWYHVARSGDRIDTDSGEQGLAGHFLRLLTGKDPDPEAARSLNTSLILYAEHDVNASTFTARVITSTLSDAYSAVTGAIGALRGPLHGGANEAAMALIERFDDPDEAEGGILGMLARKDKIMGFGHRVYTTSDPRSVITKPVARRLSTERGREDVFAVAERIDEVMWREKQLFPNADYYTALVYHFNGIPTPLFTPIFALSRTSGWMAHVIEQRADNKLIRPSSEYVGPPLQRWVPIDERTGAAPGAEGAAEGRDS